MLVLNIIGFVSDAFLIKVVATEMMPLSFLLWKEGITEISATAEEMAQLHVPGLGTGEEIIKGLEKLTISMCVFGFFTWIGTIAGAERIIAINHLSPATDLSQPGQSIPFAIGIIQLLDGLASGIRPEESN